ncbi:acetyl-CoA C-acyltransferase [Chengkuizengella axinellae]|uniref:acetyl-CoA C-acyltransferase n=1 Tax=Chengkuizengella axinellae TaxID=3064388 RepID=A0ABT9J541_9BACL|nr:acetyl-CoA C-acyltransferase [Chengkuizengella sp. 2205SS18-9]MDP5276693.1 acetyl-CoA C-acyltransferase [Chengkuizengella sp. 2205SS18-9]
MKEAVIVSAVRTPMGKAYKGSLSNTRAEDLGALVVEEVIKRTPGLEKEEIEDVIIGCAMPEGEQGLNMGRIVSLRAGLPDHVPALTINRFCASGLQSIAFAADRIKCGSAEVIVAGGVESMSHVPMSGFKPQPNPYLVDARPEVYIQMGITAENVAQKYDINREKQDAFAVKSHQKAAAAIQEGKFGEEIVSVPVTQSFLNEQGKQEQRSFSFQIDEGVRPGTTLEILSSLKPAFSVKGTVTAGNTSQMNDAASAVIVMSREKAEELGLETMAIFKSFAVAGVAPEIMGIGPVEAIPKALKQAGITIEDVDLFEINEAFASQCLAVIEELGIDQEKVNVNGGAIALGHPLGCTGTKLTTTLLHEAKKRQSKYGVVSMCIGGGMGAAGVFEFV